MAIDQITSASLASGVPTRAQLPAGSILQVVQTVKTDTFSTANGTGNPATITGLSASITPTSASSRILIQANFGQLSGSSETTWGIFMFRNGTKINFGDAAGSRAQGSIAGGIASSGATYRGNSASIMFVDSPATTSALSYTFSLGSNGSATIYLNQDGRNTDAANDSTRTTTTVILMEIAG
jgi:hypothetical protein